MAARLPGVAWAQTSTSSSTSTSTSTTSTTVDRCLGDPVRVNLPDGGVQCRRPDGSVVCILPAAFFGTCPPLLPEGPLREPTVPVTVAISTGPAGDPAPTRSSVRFTG